MFGIKAACGRNVFSSQSRSCSLVLSFLPTTLTRRLRSLSFFVYPVQRTQMEGTREALSGLRTRFYRVLRERNKLKSRCDRLSENLGKLNNAPPQNRETGIGKDIESKSNPHGGCGTREDKKSRCGVPEAPVKSKRAPASAVDDMCSWRWSPPERAGTGTRAVPGGQ